MNGDLSDLRERMLDRQRKHHVQSMVASGLAFAVFALSLTLLGAFLWYLANSP